MTRKVQLDDGCTLCFPGQSSDFADGVEIGILTAHMDRGQPHHAQWIAAGNIEQARVLAERFGYRLAQGASDGELVHITLRRGSVKPRLAVVYSA